VKRIRKVVLTLAVVAALTVGLSACTIYKTGSLTATQPAGIGNVLVHFELCTGGNEGCGPNEFSGQGQAMVAIAVPNGSVTPQSLTASPNSAAGPTLTLTRNQEVADRIAESQTEPGAPPWPPPGTELAGYLSGTFSENAGDNLTWAVNAEIGLPGVAAKAPFAGPYPVGLGTGWREVSPERPATRPVNCFEINSNPGEEAIYGFCGPVAELVAGVSDLKISGNEAATPVFPGARVTIGYTLAFGSTAAPRPTFTLSAGSSLPKATTAVKGNTKYAPGVNASTGLAKPASRRIQVGVPAGARPGVYNVSLIAKTVTGGTATGTTQIRVVKPKLKIGGLKRNKAKGTALLKIRVPGAGRLAVTAKGLVGIRRNLKSARTARIRLQTRAGGGAERSLLETGKAKLKLAITFTPTGASAVTVKKAVVLRKR
jgi:hypothetical protein